MEGKLLLLFPAMSASFCPNWLAGYLVVEEFLHHLTKRS
jgi:hypothetical protein